MPHFSIGNASLGLVTCESAEYYMDDCSTILMEPKLLKCLSNAQYDACDSEIACFLHMAWSSDPKFLVAHCAGIPLIMYHNLMD